ncbi:urease accessory protein [Paracoccus pantotrophus]|nr:urease accessory protein [Paracoccus pantotrophus]
MLIVREILGHADETRFRHRRPDRIWIAAADAGRRRLRRTSEAGADVGIDLQKPGWLSDGAVLDDDGTRILIVARLPEEVMIVTLSETDILAAFRVGHALGNRHAPCELRGREVIVPVTETPELTARPLLAHNIDPAHIRFARIPFAADAPPVCAGAGHDHPADRPRHHHHHHHAE